MLYIPQLVNNVANVSELKQYEGKVEEEAYEEAEEKEEEDEVQVQVSLLPAPAVSRGVARRRRGSSV